jgi:FG-GAP-like repeat/PASTA domain/FG-GAP repeat
LRGGYVDIRKMKADGTQRGRQRRLVAFLVGCLALLLAALAPSAAPAPGVVSMTRVVSSAATVSSGFAPAASYAAGKGPVSVAVRDLNGDVKPDLVTANLYAGTVSVLLNRGDGSFQTRKDYRAGADPRAVATGDLSGDGNPDLVTVSSDAGIVSVLLNRGDGSFQPRHDYRIELGPVAVAIGDLNGDGKRDVATANRTATVSLLLNRGGGTLRPAGKYRTGLEPVSVAIGNLNGDSKPDLVTANVEANTVSVHLSRGDGTFQPRRSYATDRHPMAVAIDDVNGDGKPDLVTANLDASSVSVLLNRADGSFQARNDYRAGGDPRSVAIGDVDGDAKPDIVTGKAEESTVSVLPNRGDGNLAPGRDYATGRHPVSVAIGDLNGDGIPDLATANLEESTLSALLGSTSALCTVPNVTGMTVPAATEAIGDVNCRVGTIGRAYSDTINRDRVISERPRPGTTLPNGGEIDLVVSKGRTNQAPAPPHGLLLRNTLGNRHEVTHSAYGPNLVPFDCRDRTTPFFGRRCRYDVRGKLAYPQGVSGGAATVAGGPYFPAARVHTALLRTSILNPEHGAVEVWYRQTSDPVPSKHNPHRIFGGPYSLTGVDEVMLFSQDRLDSGDPRLHFEVFFGEEPPPFTPAHVVAVRSLVDGARGYRISALNDHWIHVAGVWNRKGIAGTRDTVRLYVNGKVVAVSRARNWGTTPCGRRVSARPGGACFTDIAGCNDTCAGTFAVDNLKVWGYPKTHYGARSRGSA